MACREVGFAVIGLLICVVQFQLESLCELIVFTGVKIASGMILLH
jgi:hypothetical protein